MLSLLAIKLEGEIFDRVFGVCMLLAMVLFLGACAPEQQNKADSPSQGAFAFTGFTLIDGTGSAPQSGQTVVVSGQSIFSVGAVGHINLEGLKTIDGTGRYLIPGLMDAHAHTFARPSNFSLYLANGVTTIRDMGCPPECTSELKNRRDKFQLGQIAGPRVLYTGPNIDGSSPINYPGHISVTDDTVADAIS